MLPYVTHRAPGIALAGVITLGAFLLTWLQDTLLDVTLFDALVLALILGLIVRAVWSPPDAAMPGIGFASRQVLEFAIVLLGATLNLTAIVNAGGSLLLAIVATVVLTIVAGMVIGRLAGLSTRLSILLGVGSGICGNSAIAAVAPAIRAKTQEIASAIALSAILGVGVVLLLPFLIPLLGLSDDSYGVLAGLTVYAVPQVLAATIPVSAQAGQFGSLVKLTRVVFLGPVVAIFAWIYRNDGEGTREGAKQSLSTFLPWFVVGFLALALLRTGGLIPEPLTGAASLLSRALTSVAMAALGLSVDIRAVRATGARVAATVLTLTVLLIAFAVTVVSVLDLP